MQAGEQTHSRSYHTLLCLVLIGNSLSSNKEEHHTSRDQQAENDEQDNERPIRSRFNGESIDGSITALIDAFGRASAIWQASCRSMCGFCAVKR